jgi:GNAT superfamily N-acetyltransferase
VIRPGRAEDARAVARVHVETWQQAYDHVFPRERLDAISVEDRVRFWQPETSLVADVAGTIVGFVSVGPSRDPDADGELYAIYVHPTHWGTGVGRALMEAGEERLRELGHRDVILWVLADNPRARRFYEAAGWFLDGTERSGEHLGVRTREVRYRKQL